jgi:phage-related protein
VAVTRQAALPVVFYRTEHGSEPVREWLLGLAREERREVGRDLARLQWGWPVGRPLVAPLGKRLYELRSSLPTRRAARLLFCFSDDRIVLLHSFMKKTQKTPTADLAMARERMRKWELANG